MLKPKWQHRSPIFLKLSYNKRQPQIPDRRKLCGIIKYCKVRSPLYFKEIKIIRAFNESGTNGKVYIFLCSSLENQH